MKKLPCPENIPLRWELFRGIGWPELIKTGLVTGVVLVLAILFSLSSGGDNALFGAVAAVILSLGFCVGLFGKLENNQSIWDYLTRQLRYRKEQQIFLFHRKKEETRL
ncbi:MAG: hypothetical protein AAGU02_02755, partial [Lawsonibacter sp.]